MSKTKKDRNDERLRELAKDLGGSLVVAEASRAVASLPNEQNLVVLGLGVALIILAIHHIAR